MKKLVILFLVILNYTLAAQEHLEFVKPKEIISPEINAGKTVTLRLVAPHAKSVQVQGDWLPPKDWNAGVADMTKDDKGVWTYTTTKLPSELYSYTFIVDGLKINDPNNVYFIRDVSWVTNVFIVDGGQADLYKINKLPHGTVSKRWYYSPTLKMNRRMTIYTPPGYEATKKNYPVLYLLHGMGGDEEAWITLGRTAQILDNLIAQGKATPMIVVMPNGNAIQEAAPGESSLGFYKPSFELPKTMEGSYEQAFPDIVRFMDAQYRTIKTKAGRAVAGLSMGGFHSLHISKQYPDLFDYIGLFSAAIMPDKNVTSPIYNQWEQKLQLQFSKKPALYWIAIGKEDFLYAENVAYRKRLDSKKYPYQYYENEGGHIWKNWRIYLAQFATMIFK